jgi:hypothetical protein
MKCPICRKRSGCDHCVLIHDGTFNTIVGGSLCDEAEALEDALTHFIDHRARASEAIPRSLKIPCKQKVRDLVRCMHERVRTAKPGTPPEDLSVRVDATHDLAELLYDSMIGGIPHVHMDLDLVEEGPGMSSVELYFHARDPEDVRTKLIAWTEALRAATPTDQDDSP